MPHFPGNGIHIAQQIRSDYLDARTREGFKIVFNGFYVRTGVFSLQWRRDGRGVQYDAIDQLAPGVGVYGFHVMRSREIDGFARLPHQVDKVNLQGRRTLNCFGNTVHEQVGDDAGIQRTWAQSNQIRVADGLQGFRKRFAVSRTQANRRLLVVGFC